MLTSLYTTQFRKDYKLCKRRGYQMAKLAEIMLNLENEIPLHPKHREHLLQGEYFDHYECHVQPDWLLIYRLDDEESSIYFVRTGTYSDLF